MATPAQPNPPESVRPSQPRIATDRHYEEDMDDSKDLITYQEWIDQGKVHVAPLQRVMRVIQDTIYKRFAAFDADAVKMHSWYTRVAIAAVVSGALSVFFAIAEVTVPEPRIPWTRFLFSWTPLEAIAVIATLIVITFGRIQNYKERWILARFKAERLRLLKFSSLMNPKLWRDPPDLFPAEQELQHQVDQIRELEYDDAIRWAKRGVHPYAAESPCKDKYGEAMEELLDYYIPKRIGAQLNYMESHWDKLERKAKLSAGWVQIFYWGSFIVVACHLVAQWFTEEGHAQSDDKKVSMVAAGLALFALILPIIAAAIRTYRSANEFERSELRHKATFDSLNWIATEIEKQPDRDKKFALIGFAEIVLEADCREFLRLLSEAEWYG
jgi:hypothetical protein